MYTVHLMVTVPRSMTGKTDAVLKVIVADFPYEVCDYFYTATQVCRGVEISAVVCFENKVKNKLFLRHI